MPHKEKLPVPERQFNLQITILFIFVALGFTLPEPDFPLSSKGEGTKEVGDDLTASEYLFFFVYQKVRERANASPSKQQVADTRMYCDVHSKWMSTTFMFSFTLKAVSTKMVSTSSIHAIHIFRCC